MSENPINIAKLISMIAYKEALDVQMQILESEIEGLQNNQIKITLTEELLRVTNENVNASNDILILARDLGVSVIDIDLNNQIN